MANVLGGLVWELDGDAFLTSKPVWVRKAVLYPAAADNLAIFRYWGPQSSNTTARASMLKKSCAVTDTTTITSSGNFEADEAVAGDIINIHYSDSKNTGYWQIGTVNSDDAIVVDTGLAAWGESGGVLANETGKTYSWDIWQPEIAFKLSCYDANKPYEIDFGEKGFKFPNLAMDTLTASAKVYLYLR